MATVTVVVSTWLPDGPDGELRLVNLEETLKSWDRHLLNGKRKRDIRYFVCDDWSEPYLYARLARLLCARSPAPFLTSQPRRGVGASLNRGFTAAFEQGDIAAYFVDDWMLTAPLDLVPWVKLLEEDESIGMVRLGPPHPGTTGRVEMTADGWALRLNREGFAFGHRPALYHRRFIEAYGPFAEGTSALECERLYNERFAATPGPDIVLALPHPWQHCDGPELAYIEPSEERA